MRIYKTGIIGCGRIAGGFDTGTSGPFVLTHAGAYTKHLRTELAAVCEPNASRRRAFQKKWRVPSAYKDIGKMMENEAVDIVSVCTPSPTHLDVIRAVLHYPVKAIFCEKPIASISRDAEIIVKACARKRVLLMVNHQRRFDPFHRELAAKIRRLEVGRIQQVNVYYTRGIFNTGIHVVDYLRFLFGEPVEVLAHPSWNVSRRRGDPNLDGVIRFRGGPDVALKACDDRNFIILEIDIVGSRARVRFDQTVEYFESSDINPLLKLRRLSARGGLPFKNRRGPISLEQGVDHIIRCLEKREKPLSPGRDALKSLRVVEALVLSARKQRRIRLR